MSRIHLAAPAAPTGEGAQAPALEVWGGVEYTCNRVHDHYFDQVELSGHARRADDFERIAELGIRTLRRGLLWEHYERDRSWAGFDTAMEQMKRAGLAPIVGLLHHGSGPEHTSLVDDALPEMLAAYAGAVATRYPCVASYTPVNEPNTTARFSGMYGLWYPHHRSRQSYMRALILQVKATVLSMQAIRRVRSDARLVQTEDIGRTSGTPELRSLCDLMNERRWLPYDLLCGRVDRGHPMFAYLLQTGISEQEIFWFQDNPCPPDVMGVNYYMTSDRYLDHRTELYPRDRRSAEGNFVDVEAVRVCTDGIAGFQNVLLDAWERFKLPLAITEVHLDGRIEEQILWAMEAWNAAGAARAVGVECIAVTFWAMLGSFFWDTLVTRDNGHYQPGAFDIRSGHLSCTEVGELARQLANGEQPRHWALGRRPWWNCAERICFRPEEEAVAAIA